MPDLSRTRLQQTSKQTNKNQTVCSCNLRKKGKKKQKVLKCPVAVVKCGTIRGACLYSIFSAQPFPECVLLDLKKIL